MKHPTREELLEYLALNFEVAEKTYNLIQQAKKAILAAGHRVRSETHPGCNFSGCTCGAVETFKVESGEFWRQVQQLESDAVAAPTGAGEGK